jgi:transitional endoplasmic reticulum ATPase
MSLMSLSPSQQSAVDALGHHWGEGDTFVLWTPYGLGRSTMVRALHAERGGVVLNMASYLDRLTDAEPLALEETLYQVLMGALREHQVVLVDDLQLLNDVVCCGFYYPKRNFLHAPLEVAAGFAREHKRKLLFAMPGAAPQPIQGRAHVHGFKRLELADFRFFIDHFLGGDGAALDVAKIQRFAPKLNVHQIRTACVELRRRAEAPTTEAMIEFLRASHMVSNVDVGEVQEVDLSDLRGVDDIVAALEANIILPLEDDALAAEMRIKPKRGVLIAGPPGTGKTTIGRALARRLRGKFFLIDGTFISGSRQFYERIHQVFEGAKQNAPAIIFIDDSDVIFENGKEQGLYRYLLTALDGLESESAGRVCVMMTAMDVGALPPALVRSGRVELWLETRLPDRAARLLILQDLIRDVPPLFHDADLARLADETDGLTGADVKRVIEDGKVLYAFDRAKGRPLGAVTDYFVRAVATVRENKERYADAEAASVPDRAFPKTRSPSSPTSAAKTRSTLETRSGRPCRRR